MPEEKRKLNAWVPVSLYSKLENAGYDNITQALIKALEEFFEDPLEDITGYKQDIEKLTDENIQLKEDIAGYQKDIEGSGKDLERIQEGHKQDITRYKENIKSLNSEIERLQAVIMEAPDPLELARLQERNEGLNLVITEKEKRIEDLTREVSRLDMFAHYFKTAEIKQIEAPASEKKKKPFWKFW
jgi:predicted RNase H-like nuclease (RuvC/YqgF family)